MKNLIDLEKEFDFLPKDVTVEINGMKPQFFLNGKEITAKEAIPQKTEKDGIEVKAYFHNNGTLSAIVREKDSKIDGTSLGFNEDGRLNAFAYSENEKTKQETQLEYEEGHISKISHFENGEQTSEEYRNEQGRYTGITNMQGENNHGLCTLS